MWVAWIRGCTPTVEHPKGSKLILHPAMQALVQYLCEMQQTMMFGNWATMKNYKDNYFCESPKMIHDVEL